MKGLYSLRARVLRVGLLVAMFLIAGNQTVHSQIFDYAYAEDVNFTGLLEGSVIRGYGTSNAVVLFWEQGIQYFGLLVDGTTVYNADKVPSSLLINDFQIIGSKVFFCGKHLQDGPVVGWFDINDLISGSGVVYDYKTFPQSTVTVLNKLAVAQVAGDISILSLGYNTSLVSMVLYIPAYNSISSNPNYCFETIIDRANPLYPIDPNAPPRLIEHGFDVLATNNYFAIIGCRNPSDFTLTIRKIPLGASNLAALGYCFDYYFPDAFITYLSSASLDQDFISISSIYLPPTLMNSEAYTLVCTIDISTINTNMVCSQRFKIPQKADPIDMTYLPQYQRLVLTEPMFVLGNENISCFIYLDPFATTGYSAPVYYKDGVGSRYSLTSVGGDVLVASAGLSWFYLEHTLLNIPATCIKDNSVIVEKENVTNSDVILPIPQFLNSIANPQNDSGSPGLRYLTNTCIEQH